MTAKKNLFPLIELDEVESTNNYAMGWVRGISLPNGHKAVTNGMAVLAYHQTAGKGQRGKSWQSPPGESMSLSIVLKADFLRTSHAFSLLAAVTVAAAKVLETFAGDAIAIKWPNDLYWNNRKAGGILIESTLKTDHYSWVVAGIGINVKQKIFPADLQNPVSLKQITGRDMDIKELAIGIQGAVTEAISSLKTNTSFFFDDYNARLFKKNETVKLKKGNRVFDALIKGVNKQGQLVTGENGDSCFDFGEVEWKL
ncbi:MAG: biotin--[acetyl-CoA-carboxylase] ligase [Chitinophagaceae bacterium]|nr:biotin--[acetyl-CoA-carboxylase] ligase [Chitinophagaceae bacterium]